MAIRERFDSIIGKGFKSISVQRFTKSIQLLIMNILVTGASGQLGSDIRENSTEFSQYNFFLRILKV